MGTPDWSNLKRMPLAEWKPRSQLRARRTEIARSIVPSIDVHNHLGTWLSDGEWMIADVAALVAMMDDHNVRSVVNLDGMWGDELERNLDRYDRAYPGRFFTFCQLDWALLAEPGGVDELRASLEAAAASGARGVKVWKNLGLDVRDADGKLMLPDDPRVIEVLSHAGVLGLPVLIHTADPIAFFDPVDEHNERIDELLHERDWWFGDESRYPGFDRLLGALEALVLACPGTRFIGAHGGCAAEDLDRVERLLDAAQNYSIDIGGRMAELGRQPRRFRELIERHPDRVLFGTDNFPIDGADYRQHFRFLESDDESFDYAEGSDIPPQGRWTVSALALPPGLLEAIYQGNAVRVLGLGR